MALSYGNLISNFLNKEIDILVMPISIIVMIIIIFIMGTVITIRN